MFITPLKVRVKNLAYKREHAEEIYEKNKEYRLKNINIIKEKKKKYRLKNLEKISKRDKNYYLKNSDKIKEMVRTNPKKSEYGKKYRNKHKEELNFKRKKYYEKNREKILLKQREKNKKDPLFNRRQNLKRKFRITLEQYDKILKEQEGICIICKVPPNGANLAVDHDHNTGKIRGLLCNKCNNGLGCFNDNIFKLKAAINYLESWEIAV